jgi:hypothetical protein
MPADPADDPNRRQNMTRLDEGTCSMCRRVPLSHLALDVEPPVEGWVSYFESKGITVLDDAAGRPSVPRHVLADLIDEQKRREAALIEEAAVNAAALEQPIGVGIPVLDGLGNTRGNWAEWEPAPHRRARPLAAPR